MKSAALGVLLAIGLILGLVYVASLPSLPAPAQAQQQESAGMEFAIAPVVAVTVLVATPTPGGTDYNATRSALEIKAAGDRAAGDEAYRLAGEAEREAQAAMATVQVAQATATASIAETETAIQATQGAELHAIAIQESQAAAAIEVAAGADRATRQAAVALTAEAEQEVIHAHKLALAAKDRRAETRAADLGEFWDSYVWPIAKGAFILALIAAAIILVFQLTMAGRLMDRLIDFSSTVSGHWEPALNGTAYPVEQMPQLGSKVLAPEDGDMLQMLIRAVKADCFQFDRLVDAGYPLDKKKWVGLMARLDRDGWVIKVRVGGSVDKWIVRQDSRGQDIPIHEILTSYRTAFQTMGPSPSPMLTGATP